MSSTLMESTIMLCDKMKMMIELILFDVSQPRRSTNNGWFDMVRINIMSNYEVHKEIRNRIKSNKNPINARIIFILL